MNPTACTGQSGGPGAPKGVQEGPTFKIKRIEVKAGGLLSLQLHHRRSEHWIVVSGTARVTRDEDIYLVGANESTFIPVGPGTASRTRAASRW